MPATATVEPATIEPQISSPLTSDASPTVTYDSLNHVISATVIVSQLPGQLEPNIVAAPFTMPRGNWTVQWNLIAGTGIVSVTFPPPPQDGIVVPKDQQPPIPPNVTVGDSQRNSDTQWQIQFTNGVTTINSFRYDIYVQVPDPFTNGSSSGPIYHHDPTIAVTQDPIT
jgi:hypothetical protein